MIIMRLLISIAYYGASERSHFGYWRPEYHLWTVGGRLPAKSANGLLADPLGFRQFSAAL